MNKGNLGSTQRQVGKQQPMYLEFKASFYPASPPNPLTTFLRGFFLLLLPPWQQKQVFP